MAHLDGIHYGYDQISSSHELPLTYDSSEWENSSFYPSTKKVILAARNEYPINQMMDHNEQLSAITEKVMTKKLRDPNYVAPPAQKTSSAVEGFFGTHASNNRDYSRGGLYSSLEEPKETFKLRNMKEKFTSGNDDLLIIILFVFIIILALQIKTYTVIDTLIKLNQQKIVVPAK